jgi:hypothetical protein
VAPPFPARTTIAVAALPLGACVEIDLVVKARSPILAGWPIAFRSSKASRWGAEAISKRKRGSATML